MAVTQATLPPSLDRLRRRQRIGLLFLLAPQAPLLAVTAMVGLHATTTAVLSVLALFLGNQNALWFVPLGCPTCKRSLHRSWLWSPFARVCDHCGAKSGGTPTAAR